jgi:hypothetical protein
MNQSRNCLSSKPSTIDASVTNQASVKAQHHRSKRHEASVTKQASAEASDINDEFSSSSQSVQASPGM